MLRSLEDFRASINMLLAHLAYEKESQIFFKDGFKKYSGDSDFEFEFRKFVNDVVSDSALRTRVYSYQNSIISLYGYLERFVEDVIVECIRSIAEVCPEYSSLPPAIKKNHLNLSMDLINKIQKIKGWSESDRKARLSSAVSNMSSFMAEQGALAINHDAFIGHTSNFRYDTIHEIFTKLGIDAISKQCLSEQDLLNALCERNGVEGDVSHKALISYITAELDNLAHRRNEVAHGVRIDDIDSPELIISRIKIIELYVSAIAGVVNKYIRDYTFSVSPKVFIGKPDCIFTKIKVIGFEGISAENSSGNEQSLAVGDLLFAVNEESLDKCISGKILSLKFNGADQETVKIPCEGDVSMKVDFEFSENFRKRSIFIALTKKAHDEVVAK